MLASQKRLMALVGAVAVTVVVAALVYMVGMERLEGTPRGFWHALMWAAETLTTTGYGADSVWHHPLMIVFVVLLQFLGVFLIFLVFPVYLVPFLEERFETRLPKAAPTKLKDHVVIYRYGPPVADLVVQLADAGVPALVLEEEEETARRLLEQGRQVVYAQRHDEALPAAGLGRARAIIANASDAENAALILTARQQGFRGDIVALVEEPSHRQPIVLAGASAVYTPRHILGAALAARASERISPRVADAQQLGRKVQVTELRLDPDSPLAGKTLGQADIGARTGATVIGQWVGGRLVVSPTAEMRLEPSGVLVAVGSQESIDRLAQLAGGRAALVAGGPFLVGGFGEVGGKVVQLLREVGEEVVVVDRVERQGVDRVGEMMDPAVLEEAGVEAARAVILALDSDSATLFATVIVKDLASQVPVIARVNEAANVERIHRAGAEFVLSISQVSGQILARRLLGEEAVSVDPHLKVLKVDGEGLAGHHPGELAIRERTGCSVVAVERGEEVLVELGPDFRFEPGDTAYVCGSTEAVRKYSEVFASS